MAAEPDFHDVDLNMPFDDIAAFFKRHYKADVTIEKESGKPLDSEAALAAFRKAVLPEGKKKAAEMPPIKVAIVPLANAGNAKMQRTSSGGDSRRIDEFLVFNYQKLEIAVKNSSAAAAGARIALTDGRWHFLTVTWRSSDGQVQVNVTQPWQRHVMKIC